jgi:hypothetical protein
MYECVIFRYPIREAVAKYDGDVITANRTFPQCNLLHAHNLFTHEYNDRTHVRLTVY